MSICVSVCLCVCMFTYFSKMTQHIANPKNCFAGMVPRKVFHYFFSDLKCLFPVPTMQTENPNFTVGVHEIPQNFRYIISMKKVNYNILLQCHLHPENDGSTSKITYKVKVQLESKTLGHPKNIYELISICLK